MLLAVDSQNAQDVLCHGDLSASRAAPILNKMTKSKAQEIIKDLPPLTTNYPELFKSQQETIVLANKCLKLYIGTTPPGEGNDH